MQMFVDKKNITKLLQLASCNLWKFQLTLLHYLAKGGYSHPGFRYHVQNDQTYGYFDKLKGPEPSECCRVYPVTLTC